MVAISCVTAYYSLLDAFIAYQGLMLPRADVRDAAISFRVMQRYSRRFLFLRNLWFNSRQNWTILVVKE